MKVVIVTGGFDPLHKGHIEYFKAAKQLGDRLIVGVNSDEWLTKKKGKPFMLLEDRLSILEQSSLVDKVITFDDSDGSAKDAIRIAMLHYPIPNTKFIFANGGDRTKDNIPEMDIIDPNLEFVFGVGGENKINSSSWILEEWKAPKTERQWGYYQVLHEQGKEVKLKELTVDPNKKLSMQRHQDRSELWFVSEGQANVYTMHNGNVVLRGMYYKTATISISKNEWHQLVNPTDLPLKIIEIQFGDNCVEEDIERKI
jgi:cytidyltransferase-like protein